VRLSLRIDPRMCLCWLVCDIRQIKNEKKFNKIELSPSDEPLPSTFQRRFIR
jgi:hypothetical protein